MIRSDLNAVNGLKSYILFEDMLAFKNNNNDNKPEQKLKLKSITFRKIWTATTKERFPEKHWYIIREAIRPN